MSQVFAYCLVSMSEKTTAEQVLAIAAAGFAVDASRVVTEMVSGSVPAGKRLGFRKMLDKIGFGDVLVVTKLDRLGNNAVDVRATVRALRGLGVRVQCLALGKTDLCSPLGLVTIDVIATVSDSDTGLPTEQSGQGRSQAQGAAEGRLENLQAAQAREKDERIARSATVAALSRAMKSSLQTIVRARGGPGA